VLKRPVRWPPVDPKPCVLKRFRITARNNLEAFQKSKAIIQESSNCSSSGRKSLVLDDREAIPLQGPQDLDVVHATSGITFPHVTCAAYPAAKCRNAP